MAEVQGEQTILPPGSEPGAGTTAETIELTPPSIDQKPTPTLRQRVGGARNWLLLLLAVIALFGTSPFWAPPLGRLLQWSFRSDSDPLIAAQAQLDRRIADLTERAAALDQRLGRIEEQLRGTASAAALRELSERLSALEQSPRGFDAAQLSAVEDALRKLASAQAQSAERIAELEKRGSASSGERNDEALLLALGRLRDEMRGPEPFAAALGAVLALGRDRPEVQAALQPLALSAKSGIPSLTMLTQRFDEEVAPAVLRAAAPATGEGWGERALASLRGLVTVRRIGSDAGTAGDLVEAAVGRAETLLRKGDLAGAIAAFANLPEAAVAPAQPWLAEARQRLAAEQAVAKLADDIGARLEAQENSSGNRPAAGSVGH
jgi:hypothetical protein